MSKLQVLVEDGGASKVSVCGEAYPYSSRGAIYIYIIYTLVIIYHLHCVVQLICVVACTYHYIIRMTCLDLRLLRVYCKNHFIFLEDKGWYADEEGCNETVTLENQQRHEVSCGYH